MFGDSDFHGVRPFMMHAMLEEDRERQLRRAAGRDELFAIWLSTYAPGVGYSRCLHKDATIYHPDDTSNPTAVIAMNWTGAINFETFDPGRISEEDAIFRCRRQGKRIGWLK